MNFCKKSLNWRLANTLFLFVFIVSALNTIVAFNKIKNIINNAQQEELAASEILTENLFFDVAVKSAARSGIISHLPVVKENFRKKDREALLQAIEAAIHLQRDKYGVGEANFFLPPATVFLRVNNPEDTEMADLSSFREMIVKTNNTQSPQQGIEIDRTGLTIRGMYPVVDEQGLIGTFEIGMALENVINLIKRINGFDTAIFVYKDIFSKIATKAPKLDQSHHVGDFLNRYATDWDFIRSVVSAKQLAQIHAINKLIIDDTVNDRKIGLIEKPLLDYKGQQIGVIIQIKNFAFYSVLGKQALIVSIAIFLLKVALLSGISFALMNSQVERPLNLLKEYIRAHKNNKNLPDISILIEKEDAIGSISQEISALINKDKGG